VTEPHPWNFPNGRRTPWDEPPAATRDPVRVSPTVEQISSAQPPPAPAVTALPSPAERNADLGSLDDGYRPTDVGNAGRLVRAGEGRIRHVRAWGKWLVYADGRWIVDTNDTLVTELAKSVPRDLFGRAARLHGRDREDMWGHAKRLEKASTIAAMVRLARGDPRVLTEHEDLDAHPLLLNVRNGTVDLATGRLQRHDPDQLLTMQAPVDFDPEARAPLFQSCLDRWQPDPAVRAYLQRAVGSAATGRPVEALFVNFGDGGNGKGKFYGAMSTVLGPYCVVPHKSLLVASRHEQHPTHVASLFRARMVVAAETGAGDRLDDPLAARRMREDEWRFMPTHTAFLHTNHKPKVRGTDEGIWRRVRLIPWNVTIPEDERDTDLADKLAAEAPGILNWVIAGAVDYLAHDLDEPDTVRAATAAYRAESDVLGRFLAERTVPNENAVTRARELYAAWQTWAAATGERPTSEPEFAKEMAARGHDKKRSKAGQTYPGLLLYSDTEEEPDDPWNQ
jgi:putative DNA primase/helicase